MKQAKPQVDIATLVSSNAILGMREC